MALQNSGQISFGDINVELGLSRSTQISLGQSNLRSLVGVSSGVIRLAADSYGKSWYTTGTLNYNTPGTYTFTVPRYHTLSVEVKGAGGGGGGCSFAYIWGGGYFINILQAYGTFGTSGASSTFGDYITAYGGGIGPTQGSSNNGDNNVMVNGEYIDTGGTGGTVTSGGAYNGGAGGSTVDVSVYAIIRGNRGGHAGLVTNSWNASDTGAPSMGQAISITVGTPGTGGNGATATSTNGVKMTGANGSSGGNGSVVVSWS